MGIQIKKFQASTLQKAIEQIRSELGDGAIILQTEPIRNRTGLFTRGGVEVTAAIDRKELAPRFHAAIAPQEDERKATENSEKQRTWFSFGKKSKATPAKKSATTPAANPVKPVSPPPARTFAPTSPVENSSSTASSVNQLYAVKTFIEPLQKEVESLKAKLEKTTTSSPLAKAPKKRIKDPLEDEVQQLRRELNEFINERRYESVKLPPYFRVLMNFWMDRGMPSRHIYNFFQQMEKWGAAFTEETPSDRAAHALNSALVGNISEANVFQRQDKRIVVLVGPTGVGKTTTIAKMAAYEKLKLKRSVSLLTVDDYKIGGTDQLAHYARILEVPFSKSRRDLSLEEQCQIQSADTIFIDTFGISALDTTRLELLRSSLQFKDPELLKRLEIHLVLPVGIHPADVPNVLKSFTELRPGFLLFTKWDETQNWGGMLWTILSSRKPVSFICNGQSVPDDISLFSKQSFIETVTAFTGEEK